MKTLRLLSFAACLLLPMGGCGDDSKPSHPADRSDLADVGATAELDYSDSRLWLCSPDSQPNECKRSLEATEFLADGGADDVPHTVASSPAFDCFYVYPTVELQGQALMTNFQDTSPVLDPLLSQGAWFSSLCEVYAPLYRQIGISFAGTSAGNPLDPAAIQRGIADVRNAFHYFLDHHSKGRKFVIMGHSQGTAVLIQLLKTEIDQDAALRARMISAILLGGNVTVASGQAAGGSFQNIPLCTQPSQTGCVIAYSSFAKESPPGSLSLFGRSTDPTLEVACTEPAALANNTGRYKGSYTPTTFVNASFKPDGAQPTGITTPFALYRDFFRGQCVNSNNAHYLEISADPAAGDLRVVPPYRSALLEFAGFGMHIEDYNLELDDLIEAVRLQSVAALR